MIRRTHAASPTGQQMPASPTSALGVRGAHVTAAADADVGSSAADVLQTSVAGAGQLVVLQVFSRLATFALNQVALRYISRQVLGVVASDMELLLSLILFIAREAIRMALLRSPSSSSATSSSASTSALGQDADVMSHAALKEHRKVVNLSYVPVAAGMILASSFATYFLYLNGGDGADAGAYARGNVAAIFCLAAFIELCSEPLYILAINGMHFNLRLRVEGAAVLVRCGALVALLVSSAGASTRYSAGTSSEGRVSDEDGMMAYAWSQLSYAATLLGGYLIYFVHRYRRMPDSERWRGADTVARGQTGLSLLLPHKIVDEATGIGYYFDPSLTGLAWAFSMQSFVKYVLTEGDKILAVYMITSDVKGDYALVEKYGSLVARILFQPLEETGRVYFSKAIGSMEDSDRFKVNLETAASVLLLLIRLHLLLGLFFVFLGTNYTGLVIDLLAGPMFSAGTAPLVLGAYCFYVPIMGVNGITEAFLQALASEKVLGSQSWWMAICWIAFITTGFISISLAELGAIGLVLANAVNMAMRIGFAWQFVRRTLLVGAVEVIAKRDPAGAKALSESLEQRLAVRALFPKSILLWTGFIAVWSVTRYSDAIIGWETMRAKIAHVSIGMVCFIVVSSLTYVCETPLLRDLRSLRGMIRQKRD